jgi:integrase/recombinase XerD
MRNTTLMGSWIRRFLLEHLVAERNLSHNTQCSYRDTMVLLLPFMSRTLKTPIDRLAVSDLSPKIVRRFLEHIEKDRGCREAKKERHSAEGKVSLRGRPERFCLRRSRKLLIICRLRQ